MGDLAHIEMYLKKWPAWIGIIFLFLPGILYQLQNKGVELSNFGGLLIIVFLSLSLYYSIPYFILGTLSFYVVEGRKDNEPLDELGFFNISLVSLGIYVIISYLSKNNGVAISSIWWFVFIFLFIAVLFIDSHEKKKRKKK